MKVVDDVCNSAFGCGGVSHATLALLVLTTLFALLVIAAIVHVAEATSIVDEERKRLAAERDAFDAFARRVDAMEVSDVAAAVPAAGGIVESGGGGMDQLAGVQSAYRETVMSVDHFEDDYGEPLAANLAAELGDDLAVAVLDGRVLTPPLKSALISASREASRNRAIFLSTLADEEDALADAAAELEAIDEARASIATASLAERSYEELVADWHRLGRLADRCGDVLAGRQGQLRSLSTAPTSGGDGLAEYLYDGLPVSHPVLAEGTALLSSVELARSRVLRALTRRV